MRAQKELALPQAWNAGDVSPMRALLSQQPKNRTSATPTCLP
jgi:hypothetical protein